jgi:hypothetical protein
MNVVYLDQNVIINLVEKSQVDERFSKARDVVLRLVETNSAIFPYSDVHFAESENMWPHSQQHIGEFWSKISGGYRFIAGKVIRGEQFKDVLEGRKVSFRPSTVVIRDPISFTDNIERYDPASHAARAKQLREVVAYWATLKQKQIDQRVRRAEAMTLSRMVVKMLQKVLRGEFPSLGEIESEYNTIATELSWTLRARGDADDPFLKAIAFMREHALQVPAIAIECAGLESLAEQYAADNTRKRRVDTSQLDHDSHDLSAISNFVPYCDAAILDGNAVAISRRAYKKLKLGAPTLFTFSEIGRFTEFLSEMPTPERQIDADAEAKRTDGQSLFTIPWQKKTLIRREALISIGDIRREILPLGGLKVSSNQNVRWRDLLKILESSIQETKLSGEMIMYAAQSQKVSSQMRIPFGMFDLCRDEIDAAFPASEPTA